MRLSTTEMRNVNVPNSTVTATTLTASNLDRRRTVIDIG